MLGKTESRREKGTTEDEMVGWHHQLNGREFGLAPGVEGQRNQACCRPRDCRDGHNRATEQQDASRNSFSA